MKIVWEFKGLDLSRAGLIVGRWGDTKLVVSDDGKNTIYLLDYDLGRPISTIGIKGRAVDFSLGDINGDSLGELAIIDNSGALHVITPDEKITSLKAPSALVKMCITDIDGDKEDEILAFDSTGTLNIFKENDIVQRISFAPPIQYYNIADYNNDGKKELLIIYGNSYDLYALPAFNLITHKDIFFAGLVRARTYDFDNDSYPELLLIRERSLLMLKPGLGSIEELFELFYDKVMDFDILDIDNDGNPEFIILGSREMNNFVSILTKYGEILVEERVDKSLTRLYPADINGDGKIEFIITSAYGKVVLLDEAGIVEEFDLTKEILKTVVADLDADNVDEAYVRTKHSVLRLKRF